MDLESECSVLESVEDNEVIKNLSSFDKLGNTSESEGLNNGPYAVVSNDISKLDVSPAPEIKGNGTEVSGYSNSNHEEMKPEFSSSPATASKGHGLKKWRRIRRDLSKGGDSDNDAGKVLSPERANSGAISSKRMQDYAERYQKAESLASSTNAVVRNLDGFAFLGDIGPSYAAGTDSENSEDRSSKSSTAASAPKKKHEKPAVVGSASHGKSTMRTLSEKSLTHSVQRGQQGKGLTETTKKARGDRVKIKKENFHSSVESDLRSSNFVVRQGSPSTSSGIQIERPIDYDDEVHGSGYGRDGDRGYEDISPEGVVADSSWEIKEERTNGHSSSTDQDPLVDSILALQSVQEALEREVLKFKEISRCVEQTSEVVENSFKAAKSEVEETTNINVERELEDYFKKKKIAAEVEYLVISRTVKTLRTNFVDQPTLLEEQKALASEQTQILNKLGDTENKAAMLKKEAEKLENICEDIANVDETLKLQNSVCKYTSCFVVQLLYLVVIIGAFISKLPQSSVEPVPT